MNIRTLTILLFFGQMGYCQTAKEVDSTFIAQQEKVVTVNSSEWNYGTFFEINYLRPQAGKAYFLNEGYEINSGIGLALGTTIHGVTLQGDLRFTSGQVIRPELVGNAVSSAINRYSVGLGYAIYVSDKIVIHPSIHYGGLVIRHTFEGGSSRNKVRDDGYFIGVRAQVNYKILTWFSITAGAQYNMDRLNIEAPLAEGTFFSKGNFLTPTVGLHFRLNGASKISGT